MLRPTHKFNLVKQPAPYRMSVILSGDELYENDIRIEVIAKTVGETAHRTIGVVEYGTSSIRIVRYGIDNYMTFSREAFSGDMNDNEVIAYVGNSNIGYFNIIGISFNTVTLLNSLGQTLECTWSAKYFNDGAFAQTTKIDASENTIVNFFSNPVHVSLPTMPARSYPDLTLLDHRPYAINPAFNNSRTSFMFSKNQLVSNSTTNLMYNQLLKDQSDDLIKYNSTNLEYGFKFVSTGTDTISGTDITCSLGSHVNNGWALLFYCGSESYSGTSFPSKVKIEVDIYKGSIRLPDDSNKLSFISASSYTNIAEDSPVSDPVLLNEGKYVRLGVVPSTMTTLKGNSTIPASSVSDVHRGAMDASNINSFHTLCEIYAHSNPLTALTGSFIIDMRITDIDASTTKSISYNLTVSIP